MNNNAGVTFDANIRELTIGATVRSVNGLIYQASQRGKTTIQFPLNVRIPTEEETNEGLGIEIDLGATQAVHIPGSENTYVVHSSTLDILPVFTPANAAGDYTITLSSLLSLATGSLTGTVASPTSITIRVPLGLSLIHI